MNRSLSYALTNNAMAKFHSLIDGKVRNGNSKNRKATAGVLFLLIGIACFELFATLVGSGNTNNGILFATKETPQVASDETAVVVPSTNQKPETIPAAAADADLESIPPTLKSFVAPQCTAAQREALLNSKSMNIKRRKNHVIEGTQCPQEDWLMDYFANRRSFDPTNTYLGVNIGCNKGTDAVAIARMLSRDDKFKIKPWLAGASKGKTTLPVCGTPEEMPIVAGTKPAKGIVHCIEPMPSTVERLQQAQQVTNFTEIQIKQLAMSNTNGTAMFPNVKAGFEAASLLSCSEKKDSCSAVPLMTLDQYMHQLEGNLDNQHSPKIDYLLVDAEGFDWEVLQGARHTLNQVRYLTFEVHKKGNWPTHSLVDLVETTLSQFNCYWTGNNQLYRITNCLDPTLSDLYDRRKRWSNVVCVHHNEVELAEIMEENFLKMVGRPVDAQQQ